MIHNGAGETIERFDRFLAEQGLRFEAIVVGGVALGLLGVVSRQTRDCDVLQPKVSEDIRAAAARFAAQERAAGCDLQDDWLSNGPASLADQQDTNPKWPAHVDQALADLARRLGHGL